MKTQHYKVKATGDNIKNGKPGCFVFGDDDSDTVKGFVDFVSDSEMAIMLFEPEELAGFDFIHIAEAVDWQARIQEIVNEDDEMYNMWRDALNG